MIVVRPNRFDNRKGTFVAPDWVYPSGVSFSRRVTNPLTGVTTTSTFANNYFNDGFRAVVREFSDEKVAAGGAPFLEACLTGVNFYDYTSFEAVTSGPSPNYPPDQLRSFIENTFVANQPERFAAATWFAARYSTRSQGYQWTFYLAAPNENYPTDAVAFNFAPDYGTPNVYNNAPRSTSTTNWGNVYWPRPVVGVENLTTGEKIVCREVDHCGALSSTAQRGTIFLKRGFDYRFVRRRAIPTGGVVERDDPLYPFETLRYFVFDALPPTTQTVAASEIATATYFDLSI